MIVVKVFVAGLLSVLSTCMLIADISCLYYNPSACNTDTNSSTDNNSIKNSSNIINHLISINATNIEPTKYELVTITIPIKVASLLILLLSVVYLLYVRI